ASSDIFDPASGAASSVPSLLSFRTGLSATTLLNGNVLIAGGNDGSSDLASAEIYDSAAGTFSPTAINGLTTARRDHLAFLLPHNNAVLIVGGTSTGAAQASAELFMPWSGTFSETGTMIVPRTGAA